MYIGLDYELWETVKIKLTDGKMYILDSKRESEAMPSAFVNYYNQALVRSD
jgi:hypothetical protein